MIAFQLSVTPTLRDYVVGTHPWASADDPVRHGRPGQGLATKVAASEQVVLSLDELVALAELADHLLAWSRRDSDEYREARELVSILR